jgi:hypothetical protein
VVSVKDDDGGSFEGDGRIGIWVDVAIFESVEVSGESEESVRV